MKRVLQLLAIGVFSLMFVVGVGFAQTRHHRDRVNKPAYHQTHRQNYNHPRQNYNHRRQNYKHYRHNIRPYHRNYR